MLPQIFARAGLPSTPESEPDSSALNLAPSCANFSQVPGRPGSKSRNLAAPHGTLRQVPPSFRKFQVPQDSRVGARQLYAELGAKFCPLFVSSRSLRIPESELGSSARNVAPSSSLFSQIHRRQGPQSRSQAALRGARRQVPQHFCKFQVAQDPGVGA